MSKAEKLASELERISPKQHTTYALAAALLRQQEAVIKQFMNLVPYLEALNSDVEKQRAAAIAAAKEVLNG